MVGDSLTSRWELPRAKDRFRGRIAEGRVPARWQDARSGVSGGASDVSDVSGGSPGAWVSAETAAPRARGGQRVAVLWPHTYMNEAGRSVGPARGSFKLPLDRVLVIHDEIDLPFGEIRTRLGGGLAGHNGLKSIKRELGSPDFMRVRVGVGRPASTDPEIVSAYVLGRFREPSAEVSDLVDRACEAVERVVLGS
jgi:peptidyl-tRNA hydrolase, PTH1 family